MLRIVSLLISVPFTLFVLLFAVSNTHDVAVKLYLVQWSAEWPLYAITLGVAAAGFLAGCFLVWLNLYHYRVRYWQASRKLAKYETELSGLKDKAAADTPPPAPPAGGTALPPRRRADDYDSPQNSYQGAFYDQ